MTVCAPVCALSRAFTDRNLLAAALGPDLGSWASWLAVLKAAFAEPLDLTDLEIFHSLAGDRPSPEDRVAELWAIAGRRSGKSRMASLLAVYVACFINHRPKLSPGETGYILVVSPTKGQSRLIRDYIEGFLESSPILWNKVKDLTSDEIRLEGNITIAVHPGNYRTTRGRTLLAAIIEEVAFIRDEMSALSDVELYRSLLPALATTNGMLIGISSPYRKGGLLYTKHRDYIGKPGDVLVIKAATNLLNPTIDQRVINRARNDDPELAQSEWDADFRSDLASLLPDQVIDDAVDRDRPLEISHQPNTKYFAFCDASGGRHDSFTICIGSKYEDTFLASVVRAVKAPFDPEQVAKDYASLCKEYGITRITGDNYAGSWVEGAFKKAGMRYEKSDKPKSQLYLDAVPHFMRGAVTIPDIPKLIRELRLLERRTSASGKDRVDHPSGVGSSDDLANALCGCLYLVLTKPQTPRGVAVQGTWSYFANDYHSGGSSGSASGKEYLKYNRWTT